MMTLLTEAMAAPCFGVARLSAHAAPLASRFGCPSEVAPRRREARDVARVQCVARVRRDPPCAADASPSVASDVLHEVFGYGPFRGAQAEIVEHVTGGGDALVLMPTGGGKSLCYQVPAIARHRAGQGVTRGGQPADRADARPGRRAATRPACTRRS